MIGAINFEPLVGIDIQHDAVTNAIRHRLNNSGLGNLVKIRRLRGQNGRCCACTGIPGAAKDQRIGHRAGKLFGFSGPVFGAIAIRLDGLVNRVFGPLLGFFGTVERNHHLVINIGNQQANGLLSLLRIICTSFCQHLGIFRRVLV